MSLIHQTQLHAEILISVWVMFEIMIGNKLGITCIDDIHARMVFRPGLLQCLAHKSSKTLNFKLSEDQFILCKKGIQNKSVIVIFTESVVCNGWAMVGQGTRTFLSA